MTSAYHASIWQRGELVRQRHTHRNASIPADLIGNADLPLGSPYPYSDQQVLGFALLVAFPLLALVFCGLRIRSKRIVNNIALDDLVMGFAMILAFAQAGLAFAFGRKAFIGVHWVEVPLHSRNDGLFENYLAQIIYIPILALAKISAIIYLLRLGGAKPRLRYFLHTMLWIHVAQIIAHVLQAIFECTPVSSVWDRSIKGQCVDSAIYSLTITAFNITTDLLILGVPFIIFMDLSTNKKARNALIAVFMLGIMTTVMSCIRFYFVYIIFYHPNKSDGSYSIAYVTAPVECNMAIITASAPTLWPLARRKFPKLFEGLGIDQPRYPDIEPGTRPWKRRRRGSGRASSIFNKVTWTLTKPVGHGQFATHTIGGTSFVLKTIDEDRSGGGDNGSWPRSPTNVRAMKPALIRDDSDADILGTYHDFLRETEMEVARDNDTDTIMSYDKPWSRGTDRTGAERASSRGDWRGYEHTGSPVGF